MNRVFLCLALLAPLLVPHRSDARRLERDPVLVLARICASEASILRALDTDDCAAIHAALVTKAKIRGVTWHVFAQTYSGEVFNPHRRDARRYLAHLVPTGAQPEGWPATAVRRGARVPHVPWGAVRARWLALYERAGEIVRGEHPNPCDGHVVDWGNDADAARYLAANPDAVERSCGSARNRFFWLTRYESAVNSESEGRDGSS